MSPTKQHIICGVCKKLFVFDVPKNKKPLTMKVFVAMACVWSDKGALKYIRYINGLTRPLCS